ncbi:CLUMA_CG020396, isoform A [Clunio marinus]|uniref:CLUMA_CG020396, isoform A n=1 Tax=Clunio marinus TaxID=568069 RepID=A0A1J1J604_9DIPT|nr:CLUMA_CG020396, isoform A [Clunio marinus]
MDTQKGRLSDESASTDETVTTNSSTPRFNGQNRSSIDSEWQLNMIINRKDGLPKIRKEKKDDKKLGWNPGGREVKQKISSRIDTNMVKLKLLDATRKAILDKAKKVLVSSYAQTESKTKLCKDQFVDKQVDLINHVNRSTETEIQYVAVKSKDGSLIITSTCAVNTDKIPSQEVATQTKMPRSNISFKNIIDPKQKIHYTYEENSENEEQPNNLNKELAKIAMRLDDDKKFPQHFASSQINQLDVMDLVNKDVYDAIDIETFPTEASCDTPEVLDYEVDDIVHDFQPDVVKGNIKRDKRPSSVTVNSWHDLEFPDENVELPRNYFTEGPTPWSNFHDLMLGQRFLNARLSPLPSRHQQSNVNQVIWNDSQVRIVSDLIQEAKALMDMFDQVAMLLGPDIKLHYVSEVEDFELPPSKYSGEMMKTCEKLEASLKHLQNIKESGRTEILN